MTFWPQLWYMVVAHFAIDFPFQGDTTAVQKNRHTDNALAKAVPWYYWMTAHALMHGAAVGFITGYVLIGVLEALVHFGIDTLKCDRRIGIHTDQGLHLAFKVAWATGCIPFITDKFEHDHQFGLMVGLSLFMTLVVVLGFAPLLLPPKPKGDG